jgi:hypothetical protein
VEKGLLLQRKLKLKTIELINTKGRGEKYQN